MPPAAADVIYSNLQDIAIPAEYDGVYLDVDGPNGWNADMFNPVTGWDINPFFGGVVLANSPAFGSTALTTSLTLNGNGTSNRAVLGGSGPINTSVTLDNPLPPPLRLPTNR